MTYVIAYNSFHLSALGMCISPLGDVAIQHAHLIYVHDRTC